MGKKPTAESIQRALKRGASILGKISHAKRSAEDPDAYKAEQSRRGKLGGRGHKKGKKGQ